jgi:hypothetical protein
MLQPKNYPEMLGKALVFEAEPFIEMVEDDNPWAEGLFMVVVVGVLVGLSQIVGALLTAATIPAPQALMNAFLPLLRQVSAWLSPAGVASAEVDAQLRMWWAASAGALGFGWNWLQLGWIVLAPFLLVLKWLLFGLIAHGVARSLGGNGSLTKTLGAAALMVAPQIFVLLEVVPFASVSAVLVSVWGILIAYRAIQVAHDLSWGRAAGAALATPALLVVLLLVGTTVLTIVTAIWGGTA